MGQLGAGVMIRQLGGNADLVEAFTAAVGKKITALALVDNELLFTFEDGSKVKLFDDGQSCCESRYMRTDDNLDYFVGGELMNAEVRDAPTEEDEYGECHEVQFLVVTTSKGAFTMANHNEHNGYYGGFWVVAAKVE